jgi:WD40 repeat protein
VHSAQFSRDGKQAMTAGRDATARVWDVDSGRQTKVFREISYLPPSALLSPSGHAVAGHVSHGVIIWSTTTGEELCRIPSRRGGDLEAMDFSPDGKLLVTTSGNAAVVSNAATGKQERLCIGHRRAVVCAAFSSDGAQIITASRDGTIRFWKTSNAEPQRRLTCSGPIESAMLSDDGKRAIARWYKDSDGERTYGISLCDVEKACEIKQLPEPDGEILGFSPDGTKFLTSATHSAFLWDAKTGDVIQKFQW